VLVLDEPTRALDGENAGIIRDTILRLTRSSPSPSFYSRSDDPADRETNPTSSGIAVILITHSRSMMRVASRIIVLEAGRVVQEGRFEEFCEAKEGCIREVD
jgi:ATP-binding cassette subfamily B (MDR/TAP) protein 1